MKTLIPEGLKGKELFKFLVANKAALIAEKKSMVKRTDACTYSPSLFRVQKATANKSEVIEEIDDEADAASGNGNMLPDAESLRVRVVANTANWCDSQYDVLLRDAAKKSIKDRKGMIPHLHDHIHSIEAKVGEVVNISLVDINLTDLGVNMPGFTQAIVFETDIFKTYNEKIFNQYRIKKINQHSIGLQYVSIELCINDPECEKEMDFWNKYYPLVINKDVVDERGFFWVVSEIKLLENSCVLFGSNELTPTLETSSGTQEQPLKSTGNEPPKEDVFDLSAAIKSTKFF